MNNPIIVCENTKCTSHSDPPRGFPPGWAHHERAGQRREVSHLPEGKRSWQISELWACSRCGQERVYGCQVDQRTSPETDSALEAAKLRGRLT